MSSFVVTDKTIHHAAYLLAHDTASCEAIDLIGKQMLRLNIRATACRYQGTEPDFSQADEYRYSPRGKVSDIQRLKSLQCWLYQCSEGEQFETDPLYIQGKKIETELMQKIISDLPEYRNAQWD